MLNETKQKNVNAIDKIISERSERDFKAKWDKLTKKQILDYQYGKYQFSYSLSPNTLEAIEIKNDYLADRIAEEKYKTYCLRQNLLDLK